MRSLRVVVAVSAAPALLGAVAAVHVTRVACCDQSPWRGGGFGMFATPDSPDMRFVRVYLLTTDGELPADAPWPDPFVAECLTLTTGKANRMRQVADLERQGQAERALDLLHRVARDYPDAPTLLALGITLGRRGFFQESEANLHRSGSRPEIRRNYRRAALARRARRTVR